MKHCKNNNITKEKIYIDPIQLHSILASNGSYEIPINITTMGAFDNWHVIEMGGPTIEEVYCLVIRVISQFSSHNLC